MRYMEDGKTLFVPPGLLGLLINVSSSILDPVLVPILGRVVIHEMMPKRRGLYAWSGLHQLRFDKVVDCLVSDLNVAGTERDVRDLSTKTALEFGALEPLLMLYKRRLLEVLGRGVRLHSDYSNAQVFFVLWALGHCGERDADALVNTVLRNSALFARAFQCSVNHAMWLQKPCSFWN
ncbi:hypothetical protein HPB48_020296 [Haemaphysalis longicornis]|uniref:Uncharacterized protein n=1 Tax=Haemaphysalis longicornis TaxID=44386 RepID=A0A9J6GWP0_HAELO|nr:hypothetical protein HPB48_020296 [Haemaphysalis longicornis]